MLLRKNMKVKRGDYNYFLDLAQTYIKKRYPFDFYRLSPEKNFGKNLDSLKKKR